MKIPWHQLPISYVRTFVISSTHFAGDNRNLIN
jgi:hypothetical protein